MVTEIYSYQKVKVSLVKENVSSGIPLSHTIKSGLDVYYLLKSIIGEEPREHFVAVYLNGRQKVIAIHTVSIGTVDQSLVHPREVFLPAVGLSASAIVVCHNHPSGDPSPSGEDRLVTERLRECGELLGIELLDHIILGDKKCYSFSEERELSAY